MKKTDRKVAVDLSCDIYDQVGKYAKKNHTTIDHVVEISVRQWLINQIFMDVVKEEIRKSA